MINYGINSKLTAKQIKVERIVDQSRRIQGRIDEMNAVIKSEAVRPELKARAVAELAKIEFESAIEEIAKA